MKSIRIIPEDPHSIDATNLMEELSDCLEKITGDTGKNSFNIEDVSNDRSLFVIARDQNGAAAGCGAFRPVDGTTAEIKRMYAKISGLGVGTELLVYLEKEAYKMGYSTVYLSTRLINSRAVRFYEQNGYNRIPNYGRYINNEKSVCFEKRLGFK